jgi:transcriptional regulator
MYIPPAFREERPDVLRALFRAHPLASLVTHGANGLTANLVPFTLVEGDKAENGGDTLRAHMARANPQLDDLRAGGEALVIFQGPQAYISPSWYATKQEHGKVVPTWNYIVVQAWGQPRVIEDAAWLLAQIGALTTMQEGGRAEPWSVTDAPEPFIATQLRGIVGLELPVGRVEGKWKASQNQPDANRAGVVRGLREDQPDSAMAVLVEQGGS